MQSRVPFQFDSVARLERNARPATIRAGLPEMANISEHSVSLSAGRTALMRRFDPGSTAPKSPGAIVLTGSPMPRSVGAGDVVCRFLAEALSLPVIGVREQSGPPIGHEWIAEWWQWCRTDGARIGLDSSRVVIVTRGVTCERLLSAMAMAGLREQPLPRGLFLLSGTFTSIDATLVNFVLRRPSALPPTYIASGTIGPERSQSRRMSAYLLDRRVECWYVEWPGVTARCFDNIERIPEMERYIDAMVIALRGLLLRPEEPGATS